MIRWMLDTNVVVSAMRHPEREVGARVSALQPHSACISAVVYGELLHGAAKSDHPAKTNAAVESILLDVPVLPLSIEAARYYGHLRAHLERRGEMISSNDLWIAAHALSEGLTLVTNNEREFRRIPELRIENWTSV